MTAELSVVHTGVGHQAALSCIVNANPRAVVRWYRESLLLDSDNNFLLESKGTLHTFIVRQVRKENFGTFSCSASNTFGKQTAHVLVTGKDQKEIVQSGQLSRQRKTFFLLDRSIFVFEDQIPCEHLGGGHIAFCF